MPCFPSLQILGGRLAVPQNEEENKWIYENSVERASYCSGDAGASYLWLGANDIEKERQWVYHESGKPVAWESKWRGDGPNGGVVENCLVMLYDAFPARWSDIACLDTYEFCVPCEYESRSALYLKGPAVCTGSPFNLQYLLGENIGGRPSLIGFLHSDIYWDTSRHAWVMKSLKEDAIAWWTPQDNVMYPFGTHSWTMGVNVCGLEDGDITNVDI
ncbi:hypothetical protein SK128_008783 [Halocaridina rubra]|uniref:C-type lectin domain-containing protein n=1 Tax=Halocaridina rubra TaxID=373956 RepID=A0AAN9A9G1_HALRR